MNPAANRLLIPLTFALGVFAMTLWAPQVFNDSDTWWHVAAGRLMIARHAVLSTDPFSYTWAGRPWITHEWLSEVLLGAAFNLAGWGGVQLLTALAAGGAFGLLARHSSRWTTGLPLICLLAPALSLCMPHMLARPHVLVWPLLVLWTAELLIARADDRAPRWIFLPIMTLWANLHGSFLFGLALTAPFALEALLAAPTGRRARVAIRWGGFGLAAGLAALLTPHGLQGGIYTLRLVGMQSLAGIGEWQPADFTKVSPIEICLLGAIFFAVSRPIRLPMLRALVLIGLVHLALQHNRHEQLLAFVGVLLLAAPLGEVTQPPEWRRLVSDRVLACAVAVLVVLLAVARLALPPRLSDSPGRPVQAVAAVPLALRETPVLNDFIFGGYLIGQGVRPYIDSRSDMYGDAFLQAYLRLQNGDRAALSEVIERRDIRWALVVPGSPLDRIFGGMPGWRRTHSDRWADVYVRDEAARR